VTNWSLLTLNSSFSPVIMLGFVIPEFVKMVRKAFYANSSSTILSGGLGYAITLNNHFLVKSPYRYYMLQIRVVNQATINKRPRWMIYIVTDCFMEEYTVAIKERVIKYFHNVIYYDLSWKSVYLLKRKY